jgi:hypothetical protein
MEDLPQYNWKDIASNFANDVLDNIRDRREEQDNEIYDEAFNKAIAIGISNTVAALNEAHVADAIICGLLQKYWSMNRDEALEALRKERTVDLPFRTLREYLMGQGLSSKAIEDFMRLYRVRSKLSRNSELWKLPPEKLEKEVKKPTEKHP